MFISTGTFPWIDLKKNRLATLPEKFHWVSRTVSVYSNQSALLYLTDILGKTNSLAAKALFHSYSPLFSTALEKINNIKNRE